MSAERLRAAATLLRERAEAATPGPWAYSWMRFKGSPIQEAAVVINDGSDLIHPRLLAMFAKDHGEQSVSDAAFIAMMQPAVAILLADLLDEHSHRHEPECSTDDDCHEFRLADAILGATP